MIGWVTNPPTEVRPGQAPCLVSTHRLAPIPTVQTQRTKNQERRTKHPLLVSTHAGLFVPSKRQKQKNEQPGTRNQEPGTLRPLLRRRLSQGQTALVRMIHVFFRRTRELGDALLGTSMHQQWNHIRCDSKRDPILQRKLGPKWSVTHTATRRSPSRENLRQRWKWHPVFIVTVEGAGADRAVLQLPAARDLVGKTMQAVGGIWAEFLQRLHLADLRRNSHQAAAVEDQVPHRLQLRDAPGKFNDLHPLGGSHLAQEGVRPGLRPASHAHQRAV